MKRFFGMIGVALLFASAALAQEDEEYRICTDLARRDARAGLEAALAMGGSFAALHCRAVALVEMDRPADAAEAAELLEGLAATPRQNLTLQIELLAQAGQAWLRADDGKRALNVLSRAVELRPNDPELLIDRSQVHMELTDDWGAIDDLDRALELDPKRLDALLFRAGAYYRLNVLDLALEDADRAVTLSPRSPEARLERAAIRERQANKDGARADLMVVLQLVPDSPAAEVAREAIERLDLRQGPTAPQRR